MGVVYLAKLYFYYGVMGAAKTLNALATNYMYTSLKDKVILAKPRIDNRDGDRLIKSRAGLSSACIYFDELLGYDEDIIKLSDVVLVDEAQFLSEQEVDYLVHIADDLDTPVICYGLRTDSSGHLFTGSKRLFEVADKLQEIKSICWCGSKATHNARISLSGGVIKTGPQIDIGGDEKYIGLCRKHWFNGELNPVKS